MAIGCLFLDVGGVLLTNGWDHDSRKLAARTFGLEWTEMEDRHRLMFETYERGQLTLHEYLQRVVFYKKRAFTPARFQRFMFAQSRQLPDMLELIARLKARYGLKIIVVSNEGREINAHRIRAFELARIVDAFVSSCFVHLRKPDPKIWRLAQDLAQVPARELLYIDNTAMFVQIAEGLGIPGHVHTDYKSTRARLASLGLRDT